MSRTHVIGIDLGGSHVAASVVAGDGTVVSTAHASIDRTRPARALIEEDIAGTVRAAIATAGMPAADIGAVGMGLPGNIDRARGICRFSPNFGWRDVAVGPALEEALGRPVLLLNDVRSHTLGELHFGAGRGLASFAMFAIGTGIGGGLVVGGRLIEGAHSAGGELGHITADPHGPPCGCGSHGCVEAMASGPAIVRMAREQVSAGRGAAAVALAGGVDALTPAWVAKAATAGDADAQEIYDRAGRALGVAVAAVLTSVDPERVLIGGGVGQAGELLLAPLRDEALKRARMIAPAVPPIVEAALGEQAGIIGAAALALESMGALTPALWSCEPVPHRS